MRENLVHYEPTEEQWAKFEDINNQSDEQQERICFQYQDCSICPCAIHQYLLSTTKNTCVQGMTREQFEVAMDNADCDF